MGIRKEIKEVLRMMDVRDPRLALEAIQKIVARPKPEVKKVPYIKITEEDGDGIVTGSGLTMRESIPLLIKGLKAVAREINNEEGCPNKEGCPDAK